jgi:hypothetical protein
MGVKLGQLSTGIMRYFFRNLKFRGPILGRLLIGINKETSICGCGALDVDATPSGLRRTLFA